MLQENKQSGQLEYQKLTEEEMKQRHILGRLVGNVADFINPTRNGRKYNEELWKKVFDNPIMKEKFNNKVMYGELGHPEDREQVDMPSVAVCMAEPPKKDKDGTLKAVFDILDTPNGRILKTLCDYGSTLGVSSRGNGDLVTDPDTGEEMVDPDSYDCECWDIVLVPAVESARLHYVNEGLSKDENPVKSSMPNLAKALCEDLNRASADDKAVMEKTLQNLKLDVKAEDKTLVESVPTKGTDKSTSIETKPSNVTPDKTNEASNDGSDEIIKSLQEAVKAKAELETKIQSLQEQLAVSNTKVTKGNEELSRYKSAVVRLSTLVNNQKNLATKVSSLEEQLNQKQQTIADLTKENKQLLENKNNDSEKLTESVDNKSKEIISLNETLESKSAEIKKLNEALEKEKSDSKKLLDDTKVQLANSVKLKEDYKRLATDTANRYIASKAIMLGVKDSEIKNKLPESYTIDDVDKVCKDMQEYALNIHKLPFSFDRKVKVQVNESTSPSPLKPDNQLVGDDDVDESLLKMANVQDKSN
jgi:hypothetical protein